MQPARPQAVMTVTMTNPQLWWPNGYGAQPLYTAEVELRSGEDERIELAPICPRAAHP